MAIIQTERLVLRPWRPTDFEPFAKLNADPVVREHFPSLLTREQSDAQAQTLSQQIEECGWGFWAVSEMDGADFIGFIGLNPLNFETPFTPAVEIGWRLDKAFWGKGYATEGAKAALNYGFKTLLLDEIVAFTVPGNQRSRRVMEKIGMKHDSKGNFEHPQLPEGHPLRWHVLYRIIK